MNVIQDAVHEVLRDAGLEEYQSEYRALLRRDWAVRVLDAWRTIQRQTREMRAVDMKRHTVALLFERDGSEEYYTGDTPEAARHSAAQAVWPELPEAVRAELGECP